MTRLGLTLRLVLVGAAFIVAAPVQAAANRFGWPIARTLPVAFHRLVLRLLDIRVHVRGLPPGPEQPTLIVANHVSWLDIFVMSALAPLAFIAKQEIAGWPVIGFCARLQRCVFLDRSRKAATAEVNAVVGRRLAEGDLIVLFPEGTTGDGIRLLPFRSSLIGAARAALADPRLDAIALQPLAIVYARRNGLPLGRAGMPELAWYGDMELAPHLSGFLRGGPADVVAAWGAPIPFGAGSDRKRATAVAEAAVRDAIEDVRAGRGPPPILLRRRKS